MTDRFAFFFLFFLFIPRNSPVPLGAKVNWESLDWQVIKTEHFSVHYPKGYENLGKLGTLYVEEANILISEQLKHRLSQVIPVFIYPSHIHFQHTNIVPFPLDEGTGGFTDALKKRVVLPFLGSYDEFRHVLTHELVHAFQYDILFGMGIPLRLFGLPLWLIEGMAEYLSIGWEETGELFVRDALYTDTLPSIQDLTIQRVRSGYSIYKGGQSIMFFIDQVYGNHKISEFFHNVRDHSNLEDAIKSTFSMSLEEFNQKWRIWLKRKYSDVVHKNLLEEKLTMVTSHEEDGSYLNLKPVIAPNGKYFAYLSIRNFLPAIVLKETGEYKKKNRPDGSYRKETILIQGGDNHAFHQLHLLDNRISFTADSKKILFATKSGGKDFLCLFDIKTKKVINRWAPALDIIQTPQLSSDGSKAIMVGIVSGQSDLYYFDLKQETLTQLTFDLFTEKDPTLNSTNTRLLFSSNQNTQNNFENTNYHVFEMQLKNKKINQITFAPGKQLSPQYYYKDKNNRIFYTSTQNGTSSLFLKDLDDVLAYQVTDFISGVFNPTIDQKAEKVLFGAFSKQGYDVAIAQTPQNPDDVQLPDESKPTIFRRTEYPVYSKGLASFVTTPYQAYFAADYLLASIFYDNNNGVAGLLYGSITDYLGNHNISLYFDYLTGSNGFNLYANYGYLKERADFYFGVFRESTRLSPYRIFSSVEGFDLLFNNIYNLTTTYSSYGFHFTTIYPFTSFWLGEFRLQYSRYDESFREIRPDIFTNLNQISVGIGYSNVLNSVFGPIQGQSFRYRIAQSFNLSGNDFVFNRQELDYRIYYNFFVRYVIAFRIFGSTVIGPQARFFPSFLGKTTLRGYNNLFAFAGSNLFYSSLEFRFPVLDALLLGFPVPWILPGFSGVFFADFGTAFYDINKFRGFNYTTGRLEDFKLTIGFGMRILIVPGVYLRFDWGVPWDFKTIGTVIASVVNFSIGRNF